MRITVPSSERNEHKSFASEETSERPTGEVVRILKKPGGSVNACMEGKSTCWQAGFSCFAKSKEHRGLVVK